MVNAVRLAATGAALDIVRETGPHGGVEVAGNLVILLQPRATTQKLGEPELADGALHVPNLSLGGSRSLDPL